MKTDAAGVDSGGGSPTYTLAAGRIVLGYKVLDVDNKFLEELNTDGPYLQIRRGILTGRDKQSTIGTYTVPCSVWIGIDKETDDTFETIEKLLSALVDAWPGHDVSWAEPDIDTGKNPTVVRYDLDVTVIAC